MSKKKKKALNLYQVVVEYKQPIGNLFEDLIGLRNHRVQAMTVIAYSKKEAIRKVIAELVFVERPYEITKVKKAQKTGKSTSKQKQKKRKHKDKMPTLFGLSHKDLKKQKVKKARIYTF